MNPTPRRRQARTDWHPADIKAALAKAGYTFARIARENDFKVSTSNVLRTMWPRVESIVGEILGVHPAEIWPSRYDAQGNPLRSRGPANVSKRRARCNG
ncbi:MAG: helix-turn-helix domain-containing protein [Desulfuromonadales bacterium]|nr:helix-turn-helix domain-containing protein [Desulfuromonadales bacterium]